MLLLSTASLSGYSLHRVFMFAKKAGYDGIDLSLNKLQYDLWDAHYVKGLSDAFNIPVLSVTAPLKGMDDAQLKNIIELSKILSAQVVIFSPPHIMDKDVEWFTQGLAQAKKDSHLSICVQNVETKLMFFIIPEYKNASIAELKKMTGDTALDISAIDPATGTDITKAQKILGTSIKNVFFSDRNIGKTGLLPGTAGGGMSYLPLESFFMKMKSIGYQGYFTLSVKQSELGAGSEERVLQNLEYVKGYYTKHFLDFVPA